jgi:hypothetical protein
MRYALQLAVCLATVAGCSDGPLIPHSEPTIRGVIQGPGDYGGLIIVAGSNHSACDIHLRAQVQVSRAKILRRSGGSATSSALAAGTLVSAWTTGLTVDVCPGIVSATTVVIEDAAN